MIQTYFKKNKDYYQLRNYKHETLFHIAARYNSLEALHCLLGRSIFIEELLKKDFKGDTPIHTAAKQGSLDVLKFYVSSVTKNFLLIQNDFGLTPLEAVKEKCNHVQDRLE